MGRRTADARVARGPTAPSTRASATKARRAPTWAGRCVSLSCDARPARRRLPDSGTCVRARHRAMTAIRPCAGTSRDHDELMATIARGTPLLGQPLDDVLRWTAAGQRGRVLLRAGQPPAQVGTGARDDPLRAGTNAGESECTMKKTLLDAIKERAAARRRRDGHAVDDRRPRAGQLRRGVEPDAPRAGCWRSSGATPRRDRTAS